MRNNSALLLWDDIQCTKCTGIIKQFDVLVHRGSNKGAVFPSKSSKWRAESWHHPACTPPSLPRQWRRKRRILKSWKSGASWQEHQTIKILLWLVGSSPHSVTGHRIGQLRDIACFSVFIPYASYVRHFLYLELQAKERSVSVNASTE